MQNVPVERRAEALVSHEPSLRESQPVPRGTYSAQVAGRHAPRRWYKEVANVPSRT